MTVKEFWESKEELAIHCDTEEKANKLLAKFNELGKTWCNRDSYVLDNEYDTHGIDTCYSNDGRYDNYGFYIRVGLQVIEFDDLDDFKEEKQKEDIMKEETKTECKFKVGDKVKYVKTRNDELGINTLNGFKIGEIYTINNIEKASYSNRLKLTFTENNNYLYVDEVELVTESKFKVGDKVRVRKDLEIKTYKRYEGSVIYVTNEMLKYRGQVFTIDNISKHGYYRFNENRYWWSDEMLESVSKSPILDNVEFDYLWNIIKPFKDRVKYIEKRTLDRQYYISIASKDTFTHIPPFPKDSPMYKGMEANREYTLEALGFVEPKPKKLNCRVVCIESDGTYFTVGKLYNFKDGHITFDNGETTAYSYESIEEFNKHNSYCKLLEIKE